MTHVADTSAAVLAGLEGVGEGDDDPGTGRADGVAEGDAAAVDVDLGGVEAEELVVGDSDGGEGLVNLKEGNVVLGQASTLEGLGDGKGRGDGKVDGGAGGVGEGNDAGERLGTDPLRLVSAGEDNSTGAVVEGRGVGSSHSSVLVERRSEGGELFELDVLVLLVLGDDDLTLAVGKGDGGNLVGKRVGLPCLSGAAVRLDSVGVLGLTGDVLLLGRVLGAVAHVDLVGDIVQTVLDDRVESLHVAKGVASGQVVTACGQMRAGKGE